MTKPSLALGVAVLGDSYFDLTFVTWDAWPEMCMAEAAANGTTCEHTVTLGAEPAATTAGDIQGGGATYQESITLGAEADTSSAPTAAMGSGVTLEATAAAASSAPAPEPPVTVTTTGIRQTGTSGTLYGVADFDSNRAVEDGDTLEVTVTLTTAAA